MSTSYHPETDGSSEHSNKTVIEALRHYVNVRQSDWTDHLIHVETVMNNSVNATTSKTPTELLYGSKIRLFPTPVDKNSITIHSVADYIERSAKFYPWFVGPFKVVKAIPDTSSYKLELPPEYKIHPTFHAKLLKPAFDNDAELFPNREHARPPPVFEGTEDYEIEKIIDHCDTRRGRQFLVHWLGYPDSDDEWVHEGHISAPELIEDYLEKL